MKKNQRLIWITDPWNTLDHTRDTTLRLAQEAHRLGFRQFWCDYRSIRLESSKVYLDAQPIQEVGENRSETSFHWGKTTVLSPHDFRWIHYRTDPPVDNSYLHPLHLIGLDLRKNRESELINPLQVLMTSNEKTEASQLGGLMPPSLVSSQWERLLAFGIQEGRTVIKPLHEAQSHGIDLLDWRSQDSIEYSKSKIMLATHRSTTPVLLQRYLEGIAEGELRLWFLDGKLLASFKKLPVRGDFRVNIDQGSQVTHVKLNRLEKAKCLKLSQYLKKMKIRLAAVDLIEGFVTDFNFTSPGLLTQMETLFQENFAKTILLALAR